MNDFNLMMHNCQTFYSPESDPVRMSVVLSSYFYHLIGGILSDETPPTSPENPDLAEQKSRRTRRKIDWTPEDDQKLKRLLIKHGRRWATIVKQFPNKTIASCRTRSSALNLEGKMKKIFPLAANSIIFLH